MTKTFKCKNCNEHTAYTCVSFDADDNYGDFRQCNLCNHIAPMHRRMTKEKVRCEQIMAELCACE